MNQLIQIRSNIFYSKDDKGKETKQHEIVFLVDKPYYTTTNEGEVVRNRGVDERRIVISEESFDGFIEALKEIKNVKQKDLK
jgi:hypothetical protein